MRNLTLPSALSIYALFAVLAALAAAVVLFAVLSRRAKHGSALRDACRKNELYAALLRDLQEPYALQDVLQALAARLGAEMSFDTVSVVEDGKVFGEPVPVAYWRRDGDDSSEPVGHGFYAAARKLAASGGNEVIAARHPDDQKSLFIFRLPSDCGRDGVLLMESAGAGRKLSDFDGDIISCVGTLIRNVLLRYRMDAGYTGSAAAPDGGDPPVDTAERADASVFDMHMTAARKNVGDIDELLRQAQRVYAQIEGCEFMSAGLGRLRVDTYGREADALLADACSYIALGEYAKAKDAVGRIIELIT
ncbi:MAG: hypothetical protein FWH06_01655 [Oscillospiraceae bacterium]|nr:hypothetical protein [Oscillospiraceae bacterium]